MYVNTNFKEDVMTTAGQKYDPFYKHSRKTQKQKRVQRSLCKDNYSPKTRVTTAFEADFTINKQPGTKMQHCQDILCVF
jgi:ATP-dependent Clp protease adapter protein ClpS